MTDKKRPLFHASPEQRADGIKVVDSVLVLVTVEAEVAARRYTDAVLRQIEHGNSTTRPALIEELRHYAHAFAEAMMLANPTVFPYRDEVEAAARARRRREL